MSTHNQQMPEQDYLTRPILQSDEEKKINSNATKAIREIWKGILGDYETDNSKTKIMPDDEPYEQIGYLPPINIKINQGISSIPKANNQEKDKTIEQIIPSQLGGMKPLNMENPLEKLLYESTKELVDKNWRLKSKP